VVVVLAAYLVLDRLPDRLTGDPGPTTATRVEIVIPTRGTRTTGAPTTGTAPTTAAPTTAPTTAAPTPKPEEQALLAALPGVYRGNASCATAPPDGEGVTAVVACTRANEVNERFAPPARAEFRLFATRAAQDAHFLAVVNSRGIPRDDSQGGCRPTTHPVHYAEYWRDTSGPLPGDFSTCYREAGAGHLWWTDSRTSVTGTLVTAQGATDDDLDKLDLWWNGMILSRM
jgi:serine/threonine-protein kinase